MTQETKYFGQGYRKHIMNQQEKELKRKREKRIAILVWFGIVVFSCLIWYSIFKIFILEQ